jgi:diadenosine tetraphosphate (Ap4A) HIT family hydrolase
MMEGDCSQDDAAEIRRMLGECTKDLDERIIQAYKNYVKNAYALQMQNPEYWMHVIPLRHMEGKDFTSGYAAKIDAVTTAQVKDIFKTLEDGAGVEYIIKEK